MSRFSFPPSFATSSPGVSASSSLSDLLVTRGSIISKHLNLIFAHLQNHLLTTFEATAADTVVVDQTATKTVRLAMVVDKVVDMAAEVLVETACPTLEPTYKSKAGVCHSEYPRYTLHRLTPRL